MLSYLALLAVAGLIDAAAFVCLALVLGVKAPGALLAVAAFSGVVTVIVLLFVGIAKKGERDVETNS